MKQPCRDLFPSKIDKALSSKIGVYFLDLLMQITFGTHFAVLKELFEFLFASI